MKTSRCEHKMRSIAIYLMRLGLNVIYFFLKLLPTDADKVVFLSRQSDKIPRDFVMIQDELKKNKQNIKMVTICHRLEGETSGGIQGILSFAESTLKSMYHMATARVCVLDAYWPAVSILHHKKSLTVIQIWHALGKIKQSGYQTLGKEAGRSAKMAALMKMHRNYDYIIAGGKAWNPFYCKSFDTTEDKLVNCGLPRIDYLLATAESNKKNVLDAYPEFKGKKVILYAPTFRKNIALQWEPLAEEIAGQSEYVMIIKGHPNQQIHCSMPGVYECPEFQSAELLSSCDYLITDYSAIAIEGAILNRPTYYFVYDYEEYRAKNGMNIDLFEVMPGCVFRSAADLMETLKKETYNQQALDEYRARFLPEHLGTSTAQIAGLILKNM